MSYSVTYPVLETDRLLLRGPRIEDFEGFAAFFSSDRARYISEGPYDRKDLWRLFGNMAGMWALRGFGMFVFDRKADGRVIGHGGPWFPITHPEPELGWCLWHAADEGHGYAAEAILTTRDFAYDTLGWTTAVSYIAPGNTGSIRLAERLGAVLDTTAAQRPGPPSQTWRHPAPAGTVGAP